MKFQAVNIVQFTIAGELCATHIFCPLFTRQKQLACITFFSIVRVYKNTFQIANGGAFRAFNII